MLCGEWLLSHPTDEETVTRLSNITEHVGQNIVQNLSLLIPACDLLVSSNCIKSDPSIWIQSSYRFIYFYLFLFNDLEFYT